MRARIFIGAAAVLLMLSACQAGTVDLQGIENPTVAAEGTDRVTDRAGETALSDRLSGDDPDDAPSTANESDSVDALPTTPPEPTSPSVTDSTGSGGTGAGAQDSGPQDSGSGESGTSEASGPEPLPVATPTPFVPLAEDEALELDVGVAQILDTDTWCIAALKMEENYALLGGINPEDRSRLQAAYMQTYDSIEVALRLAPAAIDQDVEVERWVWEQVIELHVDAEWDQTQIEAGQMVELSENNADALIAVDEYRESRCTE